MKDATGGICVGAAWVANETVDVAIHDLAHGIKAVRADELGSRPVVVAFWVHGQILLAVRVNWSRGQVTLKAADILVAWYCQGILTRKEHSNTLRTLLNYLYYSNSN